jgi:hypothetical protein
MEVNGQPHAPALYSRGTGLRYALDRRLGGPQCRSGRCGERSLAPIGNGTRPAHSLIAKSTELSRFSEQIMKLLMQLVISVHLTLSLLVPNILLSTLLSDAPKLCCSLKGGPSFIFKRNILSRVCVTVDGVGGWIY